MSTESQLKVPKEKRIERSRKAQKAKHEAWLKKREQRLSTLPFNDLSHNEKRLQILREQEFKCDMCHNDVWNNIPITLELDHINGDRKNETRANLRFICPNCHSQTDTYKTLNVKGVLGKKTVTDEQVIDALKTEESMYKAIMKLEMNPHGGNYTRFRRIIQKYDLKVNYVI